MTTLTTKIVEVSSRLGLKPQRVTLEKIIEGDLPDIRASINDAEAYVLSQSESLISAGNRDEQSIIWDTLSGIFHRDNYSDNVSLIDSSDSDSGQILLWISQNVFSQAKNLESALDAFDYISVVDQMNWFAHRFIMVAALDPFLYLKFAKSFIVMIMGIDVFFRMSTIALYPPLSPVPPFVLLS